MHWTVYLEGGPQRVNHAAVAINNNIYSFGGYSSSEGYEVTGKMDIFILDADTLRWSLLQYNNTGTDVPFKRYGHTVVPYGSKVYLWGGRNDFISSSTVHCFDIDTAKWSTPPAWGVSPLAADGHSACVIEEYMYTFGGFQDETERFGQNVHRLNLNTFEWEQVETFGNPPACRDFHTASAVGSRMYIFGGRSSILDGADQVISEHSEFYCNKIMYLNTESMRWVMPETLGSAPCGRRSHSSVVYKDELYIIGGYNGITQNHLNDVHKFNPVTNHWHQIYPRGKAPCPRRRHCACLIDNQLFLFGGSSPRTEGEKVSTSGHDFQKLIDHSDLYVLDFFPTLKRLAQLKIINFGISLMHLPKLLVQEICLLTTDNRITTIDSYPRKDYGVFSFSA